MSIQLDVNRGHLLNILPKNYKYVIKGISVREFNDIPSEVKLDAEVRVNVKDGVGLEKFLLDFGKSSGTSYNKKIRQTNRTLGQFSMVSANVFIMSMRKNKCQNITRREIKQEN